MKTLPIAIISLTAFVIGLGLHDNLISLMGFIGQCTALIIQQFQKIKLSNPLFEKVSYQITLHQLSLDNLKGIPETLVNVKKLDKIMCKTINQGSTELYLIVFNPYLGEPCDCLVFSYKKEQILKFKELQDKLTTK